MTIPKSRGMREKTSAKQLEASEFTKTWNTVLACDYLARTLGSDHSSDLPNVRCWRTVYAMFLGMDPLSGRVSSLSFSKYPSDPHSRSVSGRGRSVDSLLMSEAPIMYIYLDMGVS